MQKVTKKSSLTGNILKTTLEFHSASRTARLRLVYAERCREILRCFASPVRFARVGFYKAPKISHEERFSFIEMDVPLECKAGEKFSI